jgi:hypothetical protein
MKTDLSNRLSSSGTAILRAAVLLALAGGLLAVGLLTAKLDPELVLLAVAAPVLLVLMLNRPAWGVLGIVLAAATVRFTLPTGTESRIVMSLVLTAAMLGVWLARAAALHRLETQPSRVHAPLLAFIAVCFISYVWSIAFRDPTLSIWSSWPFVQLGALGVMVLLPAALLLASNWFTDVRLIAALTAIIMGVGVLALIGYYTDLPTDFLQVSPLFPTWFCCLGLALALFNRRMPLALRGLLLVAVSTWIYFMFVAQFTWVSAWLPSMLAVGLVSLVRSRKLAAVLLALALLFGVYHQTFVNASFSQERTESLDTRLAAYQQNWQVTSRHLIFGTGPAGYAVYYMSYFPDNAMATHNNYVDLVSQTGIVGTVAFLAFLLALGRTARDLLRLTKGRDDFVRAFAVGSAGGLLAMVAAMGLGDWVLPFVYTQTISGFDYAVYSWICLGAMVAMQRIVAAQAAAGTPETPEAAATEGAAG